jgi:hypothetical protein
VFTAFRGSIQTVTTDVGGGGGYLWCNEIKSPEDGSKIKPRNIIFVNIPQTKENVRYTCCVITISHAYC